MQQRCGALDVNGAQCVLLAGHAGDHALGPPAPPGVTQPVQVIAPAAKKGPFRWVPSWPARHLGPDCLDCRHGGGLPAVAGHVGGLVPRSAGRAGRVPGTQFLGRTRVVLVPVVLLWLVYLIAWGMIHLWSFIRRPR